MKAALLLLAFWAATSSASSINVSVGYYVNESLASILGTGSATGTVAATSGSLTAPSGSTGAGTAAFVNGRFLGTSTLVRGGPFAFNEGIVSATNFRDVLDIDVGGACPTGGPPVS